MLAKSLVEAAEAGHRRSMASVPFAYGEVRAARAALIELTSGLRGDGPVAPAGVVLAERLITDGTGPLYLTTEHERSVVRRAEPAPRYCSTDMR